MPMRSTSSRPYGALAAAAVTSALLSGCGETPGDFSERAYKPLPPQLAALMQEKGTTPSAPVLIRAYKKEAEVQVWKMKADGHYTLLKSYPICRWSGQLGPKTREGDRQVPEGFYTISQAQMNPRSAYYLSFNVGYPNSFDRAHGYTGGEIMVHGVCSSAGCFSMTDQQMAEIYAIARESFTGGQQLIQFQSYPFHMTAENLAKYRLDPHIAFWKELKVGDDNFEVTRRDVAVGVCNQHYVFNAQSADGQPLDPNGPCPALARDETIALEVNAKEAKDNAQVVRLVASGIPAVRTVYADGGQNPQFAASHKDDVSRPEALAQGPIDMPLAQSKKAKALTAKQLEEAQFKAEAEARAAEQKAEAAHAMAYVESPAPQPKPQGISVALPGFGQSTAAKAGPQPPRTQVAGDGFSFGFPNLFGKPAAPNPNTAAPAAAAAPQGAPAGAMGLGAGMANQSFHQQGTPEPAQDSSPFQQSAAPAGPQVIAPPSATQASAESAADNVMGLGNYLDNQRVHRSQPTAVAAPEAPPPEETASVPQTPTRVGRPLPPTFVQTTAIRSGKPIIVTSSDPASIPTRPVSNVGKQKKIDQAKAGPTGPGTPPVTSQDQADAEAAKAAYAKPIPGTAPPSSTAAMPYGFSGIFSGDK